MNIQPLKPHLNNSVPASHCKNNNNNLSSNDNNKIGLQVDASLQNTTSPCIGVYKKLKSRVQLQQHPLHQNQIQKAQQRQRINNITPSKNINSVTDKQEIELGKGDLFVCPSKPVNFSLKKTKSPRASSIEGATSNVINEKCKTLTTTEKQNLRAILRRQQEVFDLRAKNEVGTFRGPEIDLNPSKKEIKAQPQKRRIFNSQVWSKADPQLEGFRRNELIEPCPNATQPPANIVLAAKPNSDQPRICIDYKMINKELPDCYHVTESFDSLIMKIGKFDVMTNLDLKSCYHSYTITEDSRDYTAFYWRDEVWRWRRLPFGIKSGAAWAQKLIHSF